MTIAIAGNFKWVHYQQALLDGFIKLGENDKSVQAVPIKVDYCSNWNLFGLLQNSIYLLSQVRKQNVDVLFLYRLDYILPIVVYIIRHFCKCKILMYHNDDPYNRSTLRRRIKYFNFLHSIRYSDIVYVYREVNINEALQWGGKVVKLMRASYYSKLDKPQESRVQKDKKIVFIGHYEEDSRVVYLDALFKAGFPVHIYGHDNWNIVFEKYNWNKEFLHSPVYGSLYRETLSSSVAALAFFSKHNRDDYTRRCFEIPMAKTLLIAPATNFMRSVFHDGEDVILFKDSVDLVNKVSQVLSDEDLFNKITQNGYDFVLNGGFSENDMARAILSDIKKL